MITLALLLALADPTPPTVNDALNSAVQESTAAKAKQEKSLEVIDKLLKSPAGECPKAKPCPVCTAPIVVPTAPTVPMWDARPKNVERSDTEVKGLIELWKIDSFPEEKLFEVSFTTPVPPPPEMSKPTGIPKWAWGVGGFVLGAVTVGVIWGASHHGTAKTSP